MRICFSKYLFSLVNCLNGNFLTQLGNRHGLNKLETLTTQLSQSKVR